MARRRLILGPFSLGLTVLACACGETTDPPDEVSESASGSSSSSGGSPGVAHATGGHPSGGTESSAGGTAEGSGGRVFAGGASSSGGTTLDPSRGTGGTDDPQGTGGGAPAPITDLLMDFEGFWDFESEENGAIPPFVGSSALLLQGATLSAGVSGSELTLSESGGFASADGPVVDTSSDFSVSVWVKLTTLGNFNTFVAADGERVSAFFVQKRSDNRLSFTTFPEDSTDASACVTTAEIQPRDSEWYHVVATRNASTREQRIYVDGVLSSSRLCPDGVFRAGGGLTAGRGLYDGQPSDFLEGAVDDMGLVARILSPAEVFDLYRAGRPDANHYLFAYFVEVSQGRGDGLRFAHSHDGLTWGAIGANRVFLPPSVGGGSFRDPHLMRAPDDVYHLVWTTTCVPWAEPNCQQDRGLGHASSVDLVTWSDANYITVDLNVEHVWAPETFFDEESQQFLVFWSSPLDNDPSASDPHSIYYLLTHDFVEFGEPQVLYGQPGRNFIDATIKRHGDGYLMILKDEADGQKNLRALSSTRLFGTDAWSTAASAPITGNYAAEGPSFLERDGQLFVYFDKYGEGSYGALRGATDANLQSPAAWEDISSTVFFPGVRHGTPIEVPWEVFEKVALVAGGTP